MKQDYLKNLKQIILKELEGEPVKIFLFGSRARGTHYPGSDIDIGLLPRSPLNTKKLILLREKIDDLNLPYLVELVDFSTTSEVFQKEALKEAIVWKDYN